MKRYSEYKDSGVEWIGEIPSHWEVKKIKLLTDILSCGLASTPEYVDEGIPFLSAQNVKNGKLDLSKYNNITPSLHRQLTKYKKVKKGDILQVRVGATIGNACIVYVDFDFSIYVSLTHIRCNSSMNNKFMKYILDSDLFKEIALLETFQGGGVGNLNVNVLEKIKLPVPDLNEQEKIANYLDKKTSQIETLISKKEEIIETLKSSRTKLISETVTKGLDKDVPMKDSGVEWIGKIPNHWEIKRLKNIANVFGGNAFDSSLFYDEGIQILRIGNLYQNKLSLERQPIYCPYEKINNYKKYIVNKGDILMSLTGTLGKRDYGFAILIEQNEQFLLNQRVAKITHSKDVYNKYLLYILWSDSYLNQLFSKPSGTKQGNLSNEEILSIYIAFTKDFKEQKRIADYLDKKTSQIDTLVLAIEDQIELLKKAKQKLITEVVTGKIDVTNL